MAEMAGRAEAKPHRALVPPEDPSLGDFWRDIIEPHREVVTAIDKAIDKAIEKAIEKAIAAQRGSPPGAHLISLAGPSPGHPLHRRPVP